MIPKFSQLFQKKHENSVWFWAWHAMKIPHACQGMKIPHACHDIKIPITCHDIKIPHTCPDIKIAHAYCGKKIPYLPWHENSIWLSWRENYACSWNGNCICFWTCHEKFPWLLVIENACTFIHAKLRELLYYHFKEYDKVRIWNTFSKNLVINLFTPKYLFLANITNNQFVCNIHFSVKSPKRHSEYANTYDCIVMQFNWYLKSLSADCGQVYVKATLVKILQWHLETSICGSVFCTR